MRPSTIGQHCLARHMSGWKSKILYPLIEFQIPTGLSSPLSTTSRIPVPIYPVKLLPNSLPRETLINNKWFFFCLNQFENDVWSKLLNNRLTTASGIFLHFILPCLLIFLYTFPWVCKSKIPWASKFIKEWFLPTMKSFGIVLLKTHPGKKKQSKYF